MNILATITDKYGKTIGQLGNFTIDNLNLRNLASITLQTLNKDGKKVSEYKLPKYHICYSYRLYKKTRRKTR